MRFCVLFLLVVAVFCVEFDPMLTPFSEEIDIVFAMDTTGSMAVVVFNMRAAVGGMVSELVARDIDFRLGATTFGDGVNIWDFDSLTDGFQLADDWEAFQDKLYSTSSSGGGDGPEFQLDALYVSAFEYEWDSSRPRAIVMFTDAPYHIPGDGRGSEIDPDMLHDVLVGTGIPVFIQHSSYLPAASAYYDTLSWDTGGNSYPYTADWSDIFEDIIETTDDYLHFSVGITDFEGLELLSITLEGMAGYSGTPRTIDLSSFDAEDGSLIVGWILHEEGLLRAAEEYEYRLVLQTSAGEITHEGTIMPEAVKEAPTPDKITLQASPNPFNAACKITVPDGFTADIYDIHGRHVHALLTTESIWNAEGQASGVYLVRAQRGDEVLEKMVVLVR